VDIHDRHSCDPTRLRPLLRLMWPLCDSDLNDLYRRVIKPEQPTQSRPDQFARDLTSNRPETKSDRCRNLYALSTTVRRAA